MAFECLWLDFEGRETLVVGVTVSFTNQLDYSLRLFFSSLNRIKKTCIIFFQRKRLVIRTIIKVVIK